MNAAWRGGGRWLPLMVVLAAGCDWPGKPDPDKRPVPADQVHQFEPLFKENCAGCHGTDGKMGPAPILNDELFRALIPETELRAVLTSGRKLMPAFDKKHGGTLTTAQVDVLVYGIKGIAYKVTEKTAGERTEFEVKPDDEGTPPAWGVPARLPAGAPSYEPKEAATVRTSQGYEKIRKGVFQRACAMCHGDNGEGTENVGALNEPAFLALVSDKVLRRLIITGRPDLGMPGYSSRAGREPGFELKSEEIADLVALLSHWRQRGPARGQ